jgi:hypothetical protein
MQAHLDNDWKPVVILAKDDINNLSGLTGEECRQAKKQIALAQIEYLLVILRSDTVKGYFAKIDLVMAILFFTGLVMERYHVIRPIIVGFCGDEQGNLPEEVFSRMTKLDERNAEYRQRKHQQPSRDHGLCRVGKTARDRRPRERHPTGHSAIKGPDKGVSHKTGSKSDSKGKK